MKPVIFVGSSLRDLKAFPQSARREAGFQISNVQRGDDPDDWKPTGNIGPGFLKFVFMKTVSFESSTLRSLMKPSMCCIAFERKHGRPVNTISI